MAGRHRSFHSFTKLPPEIRNMIWEYSLPEARVFEVLDAPNAKARTPAEKGLMFANVHREPPPALAAACRESRSFALHHYRPLTFGATTKYVDLSRDILLLEPYLLVKRLHRTLQFLSRLPLVRENLRTLALGTSYGVYTGILHPVLGRKVGRSNMGKLLQRLSGFPRLRELVFVVHQEFQFEFDFRYPPSYASAQAFALHHGLPPLLVQPQPLVLGTMVMGGLRGEFGAMLPRGGPPPRLAPGGVDHPVSLPPPSTIPTPRPQLVHGAYRFKFDIEANINHNPRQPHYNELQYYPREMDEDDLSAADLEEEQDAEWCDPWPTNDDWRRFRRRWHRAVNFSLEMGLAGDGAGAREMQEKQQGAATVPYAVKGASLLWRYTRGGYL